jgi:hypothetical protein
VARKVLQRSRVTNGSTRPTQPSSSEHRIAVNFGSMALNVSAATVRFRQLIGDIPEMLCSPRIRCVGYYARHECGSIETYQDLRLANLDLLDQGSHEFAKLE